jgi:hypothetical protein
VTLPACGILVQRFFWIAAYVHNDAKTEVVSLPVALVACFPLLIGVLFIGCGVSDWRLMNNALLQAQNEESKKGVGPEFSVVAFGSREGNVSLKDELERLHSRSSKST